MNDNRRNNKPTEKPIPFDRGKNVPSQQKVPPMPDVDPPKKDGD